MKLPSGGTLNTSLLKLTENKDNAFKHQYSNVELRFGFIEKKYAIDDPKNISKSQVEYDVNTLSQTNGGGFTNVTYRNCVISDGFGGVGDFFEKTYRERTKTNDKTNLNDVVNQNGSVVLLQCLNGNMTQATIIGALPHPDRKTKLTGNGNELYAAFNGIGISILDDGSASLTFSGATDNSGSPIDPTQGTTTVSIEKDGSVQIKNAGVTQRLDKTTGAWSVTSTGNASISSDKEIEISAEKGKITAATDGGDLTVVVDKDLSVTAESHEFKTDNASVKISDSIDIEGQNVKIGSSGSTTLQGSNLVLQGSTFCGGYGGLPALTAFTQFLGTDSMGSPVVSYAIGPFATQTFVV
jgi:hypothetical protein